MRTVAMMSTAALLMASMAACSEHITRSEKSVQENSTYSSRMNNTGYIGERSHDSSTMEQKRQTTSSDDIGGNTTTHEKLRVEKNRSEMLSPSSDDSSLGSTQEYREQSDTFHQHTRTEVDK